MAQEETWSLVECIDWQKKVWDCVESNYLVALKKEVEPPESFFSSFMSSETTVSPTLATVVRYSRLETLNDNLKQVIDYEIEIDQWATSSNLSSSAQKIVKELQKVIQKQTFLMKNMFLSAKVALDIVYCMKFSKTMEFKIAEYHDAQENILDALQNLIHELHSNNSHKSVATLLKVSCAQVKLLVENMPNKYSILKDKVQ